MYKFWNDYVKPNYGEKAFYMDTSNFVVYIKTENIYSDTKDVETRFDSSNHELQKIKN